MDFLQFVDVFPELGGQKLESTGSTQPNLVFHGVIPSQVDFAFILAGFQDVPVGLFLQPV